MEQVAQSFLHMIKSGDVDDVYKIHKYARHLKIGKTFFVNSNPISEWENQIQVKYKTS